MADKVLNLIGARNNAKEEREANDFYATDPNAVKALLGIVDLADNIFEPGVGMGHIAINLPNKKVTTNDIVDRGYKLDFFCNYLEDNEIIRNYIRDNNCDIVCNPPYSHAIEFVRQSLSYLNEGSKGCFLLRTLFLESKARKKLFDEAPPRSVNVFYGRIRCAKNGDFEKYSKSNAQSYSWFIWEKGYKGKTILNWI